MPKIEIKHLEKSVLPLRKQVAQVLTDYFAKLDGALPLDLYAMVLREVEQPLLQEVLNYVKGNQSKAAEILKINRGTLRKKLKQYKIIK